MIHGILKDELLPHPQVLPEESLMYARSASTIVRIEKSTAMVRSLRKDSESVEEETEAIQRGIDQNSGRLKAILSIVNAVKRSLS